MRYPAAADKFYPASPELLNSQLDKAFQGLTREAWPVIGAVVPHAGYIYSGSVAAEVYSRLPRRETYVLIGPNHYGTGMPVAMSREAWQTPLGVVECDQELAEALEGTIIAQDEAAHLYEHSLEVQLPFLQRSFDGFKILPISLGLQDEDTAIEVGTEIGEAVRRVGRDCTVIASSDLTHYQRLEVARKNDISVVEAVLRMEVGELYSRIYSKNISACGYGPIASTIVASRVLGATSGKLLRYATSGDVSGDYSQVVGYSAIVFT